MTLEEQFADAQKRIMSAAKPPSTTEMLELYGLYKQASTGDATGARPGMLDVKARAKFDAWAGRKGLSREAAMKTYIELVEKLLSSR